MSSLLRKINTAIAEIHTSLSLRHIIDTSLSWTKILFHCKSAVIFLPIHSSEALKVYYHLPGPTPKLRSFSASEKQSLEKWILSSGKHQLFSNTKQRLLLKNIDIPALNPILNRAAVPLKIKSNTIGVLETLNHRSAADLSPKQFHLLEMFSQQIGVALFNAQHLLSQQEFMKEQKKQISSTTDQLRLANEKLRQTDQTKSESISMIAHELRSPITSISGFAKILHSGNLGPLTRDQKEFCGIIQKNTENIDRLISDLLDMTKLELGKLELRFEPLSCSDLIKEAVFSVRGITENKNDRFRVILPEEKTYVFGDRLRLVQVLINFITNAIKYSPADSPICIQTFRKNDLILFSVDDEGSSLSKELYEKVFEKFFRIKSTVKKNTGSGLGLAISKIIIEKHEGRIWAEALPITGNRFCFSLKIFEEPELTVSC